MDPSKMMLIKWKLLLKTLPFAAVALVMKILLHRYGQFEGVVEFGDIGVVLTGAVFLIGFMLSGVMADFKESEKLPGELACALEAFEDNLMHAHALKPDSLDENVLKAGPRDLSVCIREWLLKKRPQSQVYAALLDAQRLCILVDKAGASGQAGRALGELQNLRKTVTRIGVISRTGFLASGYALLETLVALAVVLLLAAKFKTDVGEMIIVPFVTLIFVYMVRLIKDVDDPFDYTPDGKRTGAAEVELIPLDDLDQRWRS